MRWSFKTVWLLVFVVFFSSLYGLVLFGVIPEPLFLYFVVASITTASIYAWDKYAAIHGYWRIKESTLHIAALLGGWPGAIVAQQLLRHKSYKKSFRLIFYLSFTINVLVLLFGFVI